MLTKTHTSWFWKKTKILQLFKAILAVCVLYHPEHSPSSQEVKSEPLRMMEKNPQARPGLNQPRMLQLFSMDVLSVHVVKFSLCPIFNDKNLQC